MFIAKITAKIFEKMPKPLITTDQLTLLKYENVVSKKYKTNLDFGINANKTFEKEIKKRLNYWNALRKKRTI